MKRQFGITHNKIPALSISNHNREVLTYPIDKPLYSDEIIAFATKVFKGEIEPERAQISEVVNTEVIKKIEKHIGELITPANFIEEVKAEGTDAAVLLFTSSEEDEL